MTKGFAQKGYVSCYAISYALCVENIHTYFTLILLGFGDILAKKHDSLYQLYGILTIMRNIEVTSPFAKGYIPSSLNTSHYAPSYNQNVKYNTNHNARESAH